MARNSRRLRKNKPNPLNTKSINNMASNINDTMKSLYSDSYLSSRDNLDGLNGVADRMEDNINAIVKRNNQYSVSNTSKLYSRLMRKSTITNSKTENQLSNELESLFGNKSFTDAILGSYMTNKWIKDYDREIDTVLQYCPKLKEALEILKDCVLSADSMNKDFVIPRVPISDDSELKMVTDRIERINKKYKMENKIDECYESASTYGEALVYRVPYKKAIERLLNDRYGSRTNTQNLTIMENGTLNGDLVGISESSLDEMKKNGEISKDSSLNIEIDTRRILASSINEIRTVNKINNEKPETLMESFLSDISEDGSVVLGEKTKMDKILPDDLDIPDGLNPRHSYDKSSGSMSQSGSVDVRGCVVKILKRENVIRLYVDDICMGYYYLEFKNNRDLDMMYNMDTSKNTSYSKSISTIEKTITDNIEDSRVDHLMKRVAKQISDKLDATFVNANQDLTPEIYAILKYNDVFNCDTSIKVSFLPPEDVKRLVFKEDPETHIGISDIQDGLIPAKLLAMLYITYVTGTLTRGQDKRVYYVKQTVETNIAQTLLNVINQIKKSNFNMRSIENLNNLLNITGRFNDYIIPVGPSGDSPIQFEVMPGQQFEINQDLFNMLEETAVNSVGIPMELVQSRMSPEFATQYTSSSLKVLRKVFRRQGIVEAFASELYTDIYATEYEEYQQIDIELPPPVFLSMVNTNQLLTNTKEYVQSIADLEFDGDTSETAEQEKAIFIKKFTKSILASYIRPGEIEKHRSAARFEVSKRKPPVSAGSSEEM